ncbi:MAG: hypothetical protein ACI9FG_001827 [Crocinitomicaceae bacterium]|jgi:hypothetical protein
MKLHSGIELLDDAWVIKLEWDTVGRISSLPGLEALDWGLRIVVGIYHEITNIKKEPEEERWDEARKDNGHEKLANAYF